MSYSGLDQWNPMEEDYRSTMPAKKNYSGHNQRNPMEEDYRSTKPAKKSTIDALDPLGLYVKNIPCFLTEDDFAAIMSENGRDVHSVKLCRQRNNGFVFGFAGFATHEDAKQALNELNGIPPLYLQITFANKPQNVEKQSSGTIQASSRGRGLRIDLHGANSISTSGEEKTKDTSNSSAFGIRSNFLSASRGRGSPINPDAVKSLPPIQIVAGDSGRRVFVKSPAGEESTCEKSITVLVANPFLTCFFCGKEAELSCKYCKKPYCSEICQANDKDHHRICKKAKKVADSLVQMYSNYEIQNDSSYMSENSSSDYEKTDYTSLNTNAAVKDCQIEILQINEGQVEKVTVVHSDSPSKFWIRLKRFDPDFKEMERELSEENFVSFSSQSCIVPDLKCCTLHNSKMCRAVVQRIKSENEILIKLVDSGETLTVQKTALCRLPTNFRQLPAQAVCCTLVDETMKGSDEWNEDDSLSFKLHTSHKIYKAFFRRCLNEVHEVSLIYENGLALYNILTEEKESSSCVTKSETSVTNIPLSRRRAVPRSPIVCPEKKSTVKLPTHGEVTSCIGPKKFTFTSCKSVPFNSGEQNIVIYYVAEENDIFCAPFNAENIAANIDFPRILTEHCMSKGIPFDNDCEPDLGEVVLALFPEKNQWYRGAVIDKSASKYAVNFMDYGKTEQLDVSLLRKMEPQFMELDVQAHMCSLTGFTVRSENLPEVYEELKKFTFFKTQEPLRARVEVNGDEITVNVPKITSWLLEKNLATSVGPN